MTIVIGPLETLYIVGAIVALVLVLLAYPTFLERAKKGKTSKH